MFDILNISHFRAFKNLSVKPLSRVNLVAGANNIGKTGILEAVYLTAASINQLQDIPSLFRHAQPAQPSNNYSVPVRDAEDNFWSWLFYQKDTSKKWEISLVSDTAEKKCSIRGKGSMRGEHTLSTNITREITPSSAGASSRDIGNFIHLQEKGQSLSVTPVNTRFATPAQDAELVNQISVQNEEEELIKYLRIIEPRLKKLKYLKLPDHQFPYVYADIGFGKGRDLIPATQFGQGFLRMLNLFATLMIKKTQILLIDEFENGLQHDGLVPIWSALGEIARNRDIQVFATTHSLENIKAAHEAFSGSQNYDLGLVKLRKDKNNDIAAFVLGQEELGTAIETNVEIR